MVVGLVDGGTRRPLNGSLTEKLALEEPTLLNAFKAARKGDPWPLTNFALMFYGLLKILVQICTGVYFKRIVLTGLEKLPDGGPAIIVANHPNTLMDPLLIAAAVEQRIGFVANAGLFRNRALAALFRYFHVIPIFRKKDVAPGEKPDNTQAFGQCHQYLAQRGTLLIFPEGSSHYEINLREIKTGTARIALSYAGPGELCIVPIALDYSDAIQFRSMVRVTVGKPIMASAYREAHRHNETEAVEALTSDIRKALAKKLPWTTGKDQEDLLIKAHNFFTTYATPAADLHEDPRRSLLVRKQLADALHRLRDARPELYARTGARLLAFFDALRSDRLTPGFYTNAFLQSSFLLLCIGYLAELLLLAPLYLFGLITNYLPYILPSQVFKASRLDIEYKAPVQMIVGLICFPMFYALETWAFHQYIDEGAWTNLLFALALPIAGYATMWYWTEVQRFVRMLRFRFVVPAARKHEMLRERDAILEAIAEARKSL
ncbi:MAG: 1-acyl-sn-glycerol-3-phosphate acyltransferase [Flavobacteriales bacterium]|jgi:1-acyl-sn-glycerol-3-phosphate acyltransferase|nr:1-acyl-sn-glycerol-3-phosphate acyltransferase [Flavobacteriales bacterium]